MRMEKIIYIYSIKLSTYFMGMPISCTRLTRQDDVCQEIVVPPIIFHIWPCGMVCQEYEWLLALWWCDCDAKFALAQVVCLGGWVILSSSSKVVRMAGRLKRLCSHLQLFHVQLLIKWFSKSSCTRMSTGEQISLGTDCHTSKSSSNV